jgi:hypothetical protein
MAIRHPARSGTARLPALTCATLPEWPIPEADHSLLAAVILGPDKT